MILKAASGRSRASLGTAQRLFEQRFNTPAYVWAVRSIEIFVKDFMLLPMYLEQFDGDWDKARTKVREVFDSGRWNLALRLIDDAYGPLDVMNTDDGKDVWADWKSKVIPRRGDMVHGLLEAGTDEAALIISWAAQMMDQLTLRLIAAKRHPSHDLFVEALKRAVEITGGEDWNI